MTLVPAVPARNTKSAAGKMHNLVSRVEEAEANFKAGYNCAQAVFAAYADLFGMDRETALKMSGAMGAGVGRMREVCGVVSAMALLAGLKEGNADPQDENGKARIYALVRKMAEEFKTQNGSIICRELLGMEGMEESAAPTVRSPEFYEVRPCLRFVRQAAQIIEEELFSNEPQSF